MDQIKPLSVDLITDLDLTYPMPSARELADMPETERQFFLGQRAVVEFLLMRLAQTQEDVDVYT